MAFSSVSSVLTSSTHVACQILAELHAPCLAVPASLRQPAQGFRLGHSDLFGDGCTGAFKCSHQSSGGRARNWACLARLRDDGNTKGGEYFRDDAASESLTFDSWLESTSVAKSSLVEDGGGPLSDVTDVRPATGQEDKQEDWGWSDSGTEVPAEASTSGNGARDREKDDNARFRIRNGREIYEEKAYLVGIERKDGTNSVFSITESLAELAQLADTAGVVVVGSTYQRLEHPNPKTYIGSGKVADVKTAIRAFDVETVIFDDELSPGQLRNLEKEFGNDVRVCDRTALILDIFNQRAATREASLQVDLAQLEYQLPRLTRMWSHLERQAGGLVKGMGEKQIEVDKRLLRTRIAGLKKELESVREHRQQYRDRRASVPIPVLSLVGYTNAGKSTLLNRLSNAGVLAEDQLFATLDPTTRRVELPNGKEVLFTDTVGFIQKLPTQLVAAFRATLEEISDSSLMLHVVDISHPMAKQQIEAVSNILNELDVSHIPVISVWNKVDRAANPNACRAEAARRGNVVCISALTGEGMDEFFQMIDSKIKDLLVRVQAVVPYGQGELVNSIHRLGIVEQEEYIEQGTLVTAHVPLALSKQLMPLRQQTVKL